MQNRPTIIGITTYARDESNSVSLPAEYIDAVRRAGGCPILLPPGEPRLDAVLSRLDGLIIAGGGDIDPARYGGQHHETVYMVDAERDEMEIALTKLAIDSETPTLCICRGTQVLNVAMGGTLHVHLSDVCGEQIKHRAPPREPILHPVRIEPQSRIAKLIERTDVNPMSWHHQAICDVAPGLDVAARAADGVIEAVELASHPWLIAVQWHPELTAADDESQQRLFDELVRAAATR